MYMNEDNVRSNYFSLLAYNRLKGKHCNSNRYNYYDTIEEAKKACNLDSGCQAVYDHACDESTDDIHLCRIGTIYEDSRVSCIYEKGKILHF